MKTRHIARRLGAVAFAASFVLVAATAQADDTEVFFGRNPGAAGKSNILFVIDTSGSMNTVVRTRYLDYDPAVTYTGTCNANRIYWIRDTGTPPACTTTQFVPRTAFYCKSALDALDVSGTVYAGLSAQWIPNTTTPSSSAWGRLAAGRTTAIECRTDQALATPHGDGTTKLYAANGTNGPYTATAASRIPLASWGSGNLDRNYTFYTGNYLNYYYNARVVNDTRLSIVKEVMRDTLAGLTNVNAGLMRFDSAAQGGMVLSPIEDLSTSLATIQAQVDGLTASGATPLSETLYEAALYFRGATVDYGSRSNPVRSVVSSRSPSDSTKYKTPATSECNSNFIVFLTDGLPNQDIDANTKIVNLPNFKTAVAPDCGPRVPVDGGTGGGNADSGKCFDDLAEYLYKTDQNPSAAGVQNVTLFTIGFGDDVAGSTLLADAARRGGGRYYTAGDNDTLTNALRSIVAEVAIQSTSFTSPTISVNAFNRTRNLNDLFITMFQSANRYHWPGNLKKYRLRDTGEIVGDNGAAVVNPSTGFFREDAMSFWGDGTTPDGANVRAGGAAMRLPAPDSRNVYTDFVVGELTAAENLLGDANASITLDLMGGNPAAYATDEERAAARTDMINWVRGMDVDDVVGDDPSQPSSGNGNRTESRKMMGDPLHAQPVSVIYGGTPSNPDIDDGVIYVATNDGYLHAVDPDTGDELWTFVPSELLGRMKTLREDPTVLYKGYGLDGNLRAYKLDKNNDGVIDPDDGDRAYLLFGMARGGSTYYGLDITDKAKPRLMWRLGTAQLPGLGQTWSTPTITRVNVSGATQNAEKLVAVFGGGYDTTQDNPGYTTVSVGNRIYMVDLLSGALLWRAGPSTDAGAQLRLAKMTNAIPADIRVIDLTGDGYADRMYATDTGARVWRFDIYNGQPASTLVTGGVFASLGIADGNPGDALHDARRFYYAPDVALGRANRRAFLNIAVGTGWRGSPLDATIRDRFYGLRDFKPFAPMTQAEYDAWTPITDASAKLVDATGVNEPTIPADALGWKMNLVSGSTYEGEKVLAEARTFGGQVFFTTYTPNSSTVACKVFPGSNRLYVVNAFTGGTVENRDSKVTDLPSSGIASNVVFVFPSPDNPEGDRWKENERWCTGTDCPKVPPPRCLVGLLDCGVLPGVAPVRTFWTQRNVDD